VAGKDCACVCACADNKIVNSIALIAASLRWSILVSIIFNLTAPLACYWPQFGMT
jgi:hypothetical protein